MCCNFVVNVAKICFTAYINISDIPFFEDFCNCIPVFILSGFEHCIADIFYSAVAIKHINDIFIYLIYVIIITFGNTIGAISARKLLGKGGDKNAG